MDMEKMKLASGERKKAYYSLRNDIDLIKQKLIDIKKNRGRSPAFKVLMSALDVFTEQVDRDFSRYEKRIKSISNGDVALELQQALNRERKLREELEKKVKEASESSGLFIKFVRGKLGF
jgi:hypothetical protein